MYLGPCTPVVANVAAPGNMYQGSSAFPPELETEDVPQM